MTIQKRMVSKNEHLDNQNNVILLHGNKGEKIKDYSGGKYQFHTQQITKNC